ncbi:MAG: transcription/translation regulatory transformer protein RfaH [Steroidobacteraceae bacterium]
MKKWLLVFCKPRQDRVAVDNLQRQGFTTYSPQIDVQDSALGARAQARTEPLFPGYVFLNVDPEVQSIAPVRSTKGVLRFVRFGAEYACATQAVIDQIECNLALHARRMSAANVFRKGERIKINGSGFSDIDAIFCNPCGAERAMILLSVLGRDAAISVPLAFVSRAEERAAFDHPG